MLRPARPVGRAGTLWRHRQHRASRTRAARPRLRSMEWRRPGATRSEATTDRSVNLTGLAARPGTEWALQPVACDPSSIADLEVGRQCGRRGRRRRCLPQRDGYTLLHQRPVTLLRKHSDRTVLIRRARVLRAVLHRHRRRRFLALLRPANEAGPRVQR